MPCNDHVARPSGPADELSRPRRWVLAVAHSPWISGALIIAVSLAIGASANIPLPESAFVAGGVHWMTRLQAFFVEFYEGMAFHVLIAMLAVGFVLERIIPARRQVANGTLNIPYAFMLVLFVSAIAPLQVFVSATLVAWIGWSNILDLQFDTGSSVPLSVAAVLVSALITDFFFYWFHRTQHENRLLWQSHLLHHSDVSLNVTTTHRTHFIEHVLSPFFMTLPMAVLFALPEPNVVIIGILPAVWSNVVHMNIRVGFGKFWWLLASPQYHRIHHSLRPEHLNKNFAVWFPVWDVIFRTAYVPRSDEYPQTGVAGVEVKTLPDAISLPFVRWYGMARAGRDGEGGAPRRATTMAADDHG
jgi:sterol desaturase/sphingolipid hydroxylase (fatty acid hydroxylase superfamily)